MADRIEPPKGGLFMNLEVFLKNAKFPWDRTDGYSLRTILFQEGQVDIRSALQHLDEVFSGFVNLETKYNPDYLPEDLCEHSNFLWADFQDAMPTYREIQKPTIERILKDTWIENPNTEQVNWAYQTWIKTILNTKLGILSEFLTQYFKDNPEDPALPEAVDIAKKHIFSPHMEEAGRLISFVSVIAPREAETILKRVLEVSENESFNRSVQDYLRMVQQQID
jgi:hypothetical protein